MKSASHLKCAEAHTECESVASHAANGRMAHHFDNHFNELSRNENKPLLVRSVCVFINGSISNSYEAIEMIKCCQANKQPKIEIKSMAIMCPTKQRSDQTLGNYNHNWNFSTAKRFWHRFKCMHFVVDFTVTKESPTKCNSNDFICILCAFASLCIYWRQNHTFGLKLIYWP